MSDSIFTKIIKGEIPAYRIYEDDDVLAFLDIHPIVPGHTLVIPKKQTEFIWDLSDEDYQKLMAAVKKIALHLRETLDVSYVGEKVVGTDIPHAHVHLIPFNKDTEYDRMPDQVEDPDHEALAVMAKKIAF
jgi:histidine triad (HIT) family protein